MKPLTISKNKLTFIAWLNYKKDIFMWVIAYVILILLGCNVAIKQGPFYMPDEGAHFLRALEVSQLHLINHKNSVGITIPCDEYIIIGKTHHAMGFFQAEVIERSLEPECTVRSVNTAGSYSFVSYIPSAIALRVLAGSNLPIEEKLVYARIANFGFWFTVLYFGLFLISKARLLIVCLFLMPSLFWQMVAVSADGATISSCYLYILIILHLSQAKKKLSLQTFWPVIIVAMLIGMSKGAYSPMALLSFALWNKVQSRSVTQRISILISPLFFALGFYFLLTVFVDSSLIPLGNGADPVQQISHITNDPFRFFNVLLKSLSDTDVLGLISPNYAVPNVGRAHGIMTAILLTLAVLLLKSNFGVSKLFRWISGGLSLVLIASVCLPLYLTYTPVGADTIWGLQGRYYLPILPLLLITLAVDYRDIKWVDLLNMAIQKLELIIILPILGLIVAAINIRNS